MAAASLTLAFCLFALFALLFLIHPAADAKATAEMLEEAVLVTPFEAGYFLPEPQERRLVLFGLILVPIFTLVTLLLLKRFVGSFHSKLVFPILSVFLSILTVASWISLTGMYPVGPSEGGMSYGVYYASFSSMAGLAMGGLLGIALFLMARRIAPERLHTITAWIILPLTAGSMAYILWITPFSVPKVGSDFDAVFYSMTQVHLGSPLLLDGFNNTYGAYPLFLAPLFKVIPLTTFSFTATMTVLVLACLAAVLAFAYWHCRHRVWVMWLFPGFLFFGYILSKQITHEHYFQYFPIRTLFPSLLLLALLFHGRYPKRWLERVVSITMGFAVLWNPDSGVVVVGAWIAYGVWLRLIEGRRFKERMVAAATHVALVLGGQVIALALFSSIYRLAWGAFPDYSIQLASLRAFAGYGLFLIPMPPAHPWILYVIASGFVLALGLARGLLGQDSFRSARLVSVGILTAGLFLYYTGRSHPQTFLSLLGYMMLLLTILLDEARTLMHDVASPRWRQAIGVLICGTFALGLSAVFDMPVNLAKDAIQPETSIYGSDTVSPENSEVAAFIRDRTPTREKVIILSYFQGYYHNVTGIPSAFNPGIVDLFLRTRHDRLVDLIEHSQVLIFREKAFPLLPAFETSLKKNRRILNETASFVCYGPPMANGTGKP